MENTKLAQWVIDNRYPKNEKEKVSNFEMYHKILEHTAQLQADKAELLEALQDIQDELENGDTPKVWKIEELIQKMKQ